MNRRDLLRAVPVVAAAIVGTVASQPSIVKAEEIEGVLLQTEDKCDTIRLWNLGSMEHGIYPTDEACGRLAEILNNRKLDEPLDLIWGPELSVTQISTDGKSVEDVINIGKPTPEYIANKIMILFDSPTQYQDADLHKEIVNAIKEACQEALDA